MTTINLTTTINAPIDLCFHLSLSIDLELEAAAQYNMQAVRGVTSGVIGYGERVCWQATQFGLTVSHESEITGFQEPTFFQDSMVSGLFQSFRHDHFFRSVGPTRTEMQDVLRFSLPLWMLGPISERLIARQRLITLLNLRNNAIKSSAESR